MRILVAIALAIAFAVVSPSPVNASWTRADVDTGRQLICDNDAGYWTRSAQTGASAIYVCPGSDAGA
jgi:hypothetical protein